MYAAAFDFVAERGFIAASDDPNQLFDWMSDYDQRRRDARAEGATRRSRAAFSSTTRSSAS